MKKIITMITALLALSTAQAEERTVWEGSEQISWNNEVAPGTQFETPQGIFNELVVGNIIRIYTTTTYDEPQYVVTYKKGDGWEWTDLTTETANGIISYTVADETTATEIAERGLILRGQAWTATKITIDAEAPQPVEGEQTVWEGTEPISWNAAEVPGTQYELSGIFTGLAKDDLIRFYTAATVEEPQYAVTYKKGDGWEWTDLAITVADGIMSYRVESDDIATWIAERGLVMRGQGYNLTKVTVTKAAATGINALSVQRSPSNVHRPTFTVSGQQVGAGYKGVIIENGRKLIRK